MGTCITATPSVLDQWCRTTSFVCANNHTMEVLLNVVVLQARCLLLVVYIYMYIYNSDTLCFGSMLNINIFYVCTQSHIESFLQCCCSATASLHRRLCLEKVDVFFVFGALDFCFLCIVSVVKKLGKHQIVLLFTLGHANLRGGYYCFGKTKL